MWGPHVSRHSSSSSTPPLSSSLPVFTSSEAVAGACEAATEQEDEGARPPCHWPPHWSSPFPPSAPQRQKGTNRSTVVISRRGWVKDVPRAAVHKCVHWPLLHRASRWGHWAAHPWGETAWRQCRFPPASSVYPLVDGPRRALTTPDPHISTDTGTAIEMVIDDRHLDGHTMPPSWGIRSTHHRYSHRDGLK